MQNYDSWAQGVTATVATINNGDYPAIVSDLASGSGIGATSQLGTWSDGGYDSLSGTWTEAASYTGGTAASLPGGSSTATLTSATTISGSGVWSFIEGLVSGAGSVATGSTVDIGSAIAAIAVPFEKFVEGIDWLFQPSSWIRIIAFGAGATLMGLGLFGMTHVGQSPGNLGVSGVSVPLPSANLPVSMLLFGAGGICLFIAFHNIPTDVKSFQQFLGFVLDDVLHPSTVAQAGGAGAAIGAGSLTAGSSSGTVAYD